MNKVLFGSGALEKCRDQNTRWDGDKRRDKGDVNSCWRKFERSDSHGRVLIT